MTGAIRSTITRSVIFISLLKLLVALKVNVLVGSMNLFFSATHIVMPLTGAFGGMVTTAIVLGLGTAFKVIFGTSFAPFFITYHVPSVMASAYWAYDHWLVRVALPLLCVLLFIIHPIGFIAAPYTFFWFIPVMLHLFIKQNVFARALGSTFTAHAVGSVIWIYTVPMTADQWYALIPVVAVERLLLAAAMTVAYYLLARVFALNVDLNSMLPKKIPTLSLPSQNQ